MGADGAIKGGREDVGALETDGGDSLFIYFFWKKVLKN